MQDRNNSHHSHVPKWATLCAQIHCVCHLDLFLGIVQKKQKGHTLVLLSFCFFKLRLWSYGVTKKQHEPRKHPTLSLPALFSSFHALLTAKVKAPFECSPAQKETEQKKRVLHGNFSFLIHRQTKYLCSFNFNNPSLTVSSQHSYFTHTPVKSEYLHMHIHFSIPYIHIPFSTTTKKAIRKEYLIITCPMMHYIYN